MPGPAGFRLDDELRKQVHDCLKKAGVGLVEPCLRPWLAQGSRRADILVLARIRQSPHPRLRKCPISVFLP